jgi:hypothetical protein
MPKLSLEDKIARLEADLKEAKARKHTETRKARNGQLVAFGILLETKYAELPPTERAKIRSWADGLDKRNQERALAGFDRLEAAHKQSIIEEHHQTEQPKPEPDRMPAPVPPPRQAGGFAIRPDTPLDEL